MNFSCLNFHKNPQVATVRLVYRSLASSALPALKRGDCFRMGERQPDPIFSSFFGWVSSENFQFVLISKMCVQFCREMHIDSMWLTASERGTENKSSNNELV